MSRHQIALPISDDRWDAIVDGVSVQRLSKRCIHRGQAITDPTEGYPDAPLSFRAHEVVTGAVRKNSWRQMPVLAHVSNHAILSRGGRTRGRSAGCRPRQTES